MHFAITKFKGRLLQKFSTLVYCGAELGKSNFGFVSEFCPTATGKGYSVPVFLLTSDTPILCCCDRYNIPAKNLPGIIELIAASGRFI